MCERDPLVPVTVTVTDPGDEKVQERVEVPAPVTLVGVRVHAALSEERVTGLLKPLTAAMVIVEAPAWLTFTLTLVGLATIVKSCTVNATVVAWERLPLVPVIVTVTLPVDENVHDRVELPEPPETDAGVKLHAALSLVRATAPVNPCTVEMDMIHVPTDFTFTCPYVWFADIVKSGAGVTVYATVAV